MTGARVQSSASSSRTPERVVLPRHELVGGIAIMQERDVAGAQKILASRPSLHTIVYAKGEVSGESRNRGEVYSVVSQPVLK